MPPRRPPSRSVEELLLLAAKPNSEKSLRDELFQLVYGELREIAAHLLRSERAHHTLQATALVHEAFLRLGNPDEIPWETRGHFFSSLARAMRQILVDYARRRSAEKRGGELRRVTLENVKAVSDSSELDLIDLDRLLTRLERLDARMARVVELHTLVGLNLEDVALTLGVSKRTAAGDWSVAKKWMRQELSAGLG